MPAKQDLRDRTTGKGMEKRADRGAYSFTRLAAPESSVVADR